MQASHEFEQRISVPTRITTNTCKTIDLAFTNIKYYSKAGTFNYNISDHKPKYIIKKKPRNNKATTEYFDSEDLADTLRNNDRSKALAEKDPNKC